MPAILVRLDDDLESVGIHDVDHYFTATAVRSSISLGNTRDYRVSRHLGAIRHTPLLRLDPRTPLRGAGCQACCAERRLGISGFARPYCDSSHELARDSDIPPSHK